MDIVAAIALTSLALIVPGAHPREPARRRDRLAAGGRCRRVVRRRDHPGVGGALFRHLQRRDPRDRPGRRRSGGARGGGRGARLRVARARVRRSARAPDRGPRRPAARCLLPPPPGRGPTAADLRRRGRVGRHRGRGARLAARLVVHRRIAGWWTAALSGTLWASSTWCGAVTLGVGSAPGSPFRFIHEHPGSGAIGTLPWVLIPGFLVPIYLLTHLAVFARLAGGAQGDRAGTWYASV